ncbi:MAG: FAD binding domain-containing protein [Burkholderiales bacterium]
MKSPDFDYVKVQSIEHALGLLQTHGDNARILAGGQTLLATLNMRLSEPVIVIDITGLDVLRGVTVQNGMLRIGALTTHSEIEDSTLVATHAPLLMKAAPHIAHRAIRNMGTWGGSIAYADPAAEWPACLLALNGTVLIHGQNGERRIKADDFFLNLYTTALVDGEIITGCEIPIKTATSWSGFSELARRHGDYAITGLAASAERANDQLQNCRFVFMGVGTTPIRARKAEAVMNNSALDSKAISSAVTALRDELEPIPDLTNSSDTKRQLAAVLLERLLQSAAN